MCGGCGEVVGAGGERGGRVRVERGIRGVENCVCGGVG